MFGSWNSQPTTQAPTTQALSAEDREHRESLMQLFDADGTRHQQKGLKPARPVKRTGETVAVKVGGKTKYQSKHVQTGHVVCNPGGCHSCLSNQEFVRQTLGRPGIKILQNNDNARQGCRYFAFFKTVSAVEITPEIKQSHFTRADGTEVKLPPAGDMWGNADPYSVEVGEILVRVEWHGMTKLEEQLIHTINPATFKKLYQRVPEVDLSSQCDEDLRLRFRREAQYIEMSYWLDQTGQPYHAAGWKAVRDAIEGEVVHVTLGSEQTMKRTCKANEKVVMGQTGCEIVWSAEDFEQRNKRTTFRKLQHPAFLERDVNAERYQEFWSTRTVKAIQLCTDEDVKKCGEHIHGYGLYAGQITRPQKDMWIVIPEDKEEVRVVLDDEFKDRYTLGKPPNSNFLSCFKGLICW